MVLYSWSLVSSSFKILLELSFPSITIISNLFQALSPLHLDFSSLLIDPPASSPPMTKLLVLFPQIQCSACQLPLETPADSFCWSSPYSQSQHSRSFRMWTLLYPYFCFDTITLSHLPVSCRCHIHSFIYHPLNVELVHCLTHWPLPTKSSPSFRGQSKCSSSVKKHPLTPLISLTAPIMFLFFFLF